MTVRTIPITALAIGFATLLTLSACTGRTTGDTAAAVEGHDLVPADDVLTGESIFDLDVAMVDHDGKQATLADLKGQITVAAMVYTSCTTICIMITDEMKRLERQLAGADRDVRYVLFSLDPGRDSPAAMRTFAETHRLDLGRWRLLAASEDGVRDLAAVLGVKYRMEAGGEIAHSALIFVIDRDGVVRHRQEGVGRESQALVAAVARAREGS